MVLDGVLEDQRLIWSGDIPSIPDRTRVPAFTADEVALVVAPFWTLVSQQCRQVRRKERYNETKRSFHRFGCIEQLKVMSRTERLLACVSFRISLSRSLPDFVVAGIAVGVGHIALTISPEAVVESA